MTHQRFEFGDQVRHSHRPEWGLGTIVKVEQVHQAAKIVDRLSIRFSNAGLKTLVDPNGQLERANVEVDVIASNGNQKSVAEWDTIKNAGWLGSMADRKFDEAMSALPDDVRDPFLGIEARLDRSLKLYRFERSGKALIDWAVAQTGLDDPLSRFTRHELEDYFDRWAVERDNHFSQLLVEAGRDQNLIDRIMAAAPPSARNIVTRLTASR